MVRISIAVSLKSRVFVAPTGPTKPGRSNEYPHTRHDSQPIQLSHCSDSENSALPWPLLGFLANVRPLVTLHPTKRMQVGRETTLEYPDAGRGTIQMRNRVPGESETEVGTCEPACQQVERPRRWRTLVGALSPNNEGSSKPAWRTDATPMEKTVLYRGKNRLARSNPQRPLLPMGSPERAIRPRAVPASSSSRSSRSGGCALRRRRIAGRARARSACSL